MVSHVRRAVALATLFVVTTASFVPAGAAPRPQPTASPSSEVPLPGTLSLPLADPYPSTYKPFPSRPTLIRHATLLTAAGPALDDASAAGR